MKGTAFKDFASRRTVRVKGLIIQPSIAEELSTFLEDLSPLKAADEAALFEPVLKGDDIESVIGSIEALYDDLNRDLEDLARAKSSLGDALSVVKKVVEKEIQNIREDGKRAKAKIMKAFEMTKKRRRRALKRDLEKIRREGWISDSEYIRLNDELVEGLGLISRP